MTQSLSSYESARDALLWKSRTAVSVGDVAMTHARDPWLLPEGVEEALPLRARTLEALRRRLLNLYDGWGYDLIIPPLIEYLDSLLTGTGHELDLQTFKLTDQLSGRLLGVRADITPQAARVDANRIGRDGPVRLCYIGDVLRTRPDGPGGSRTPLQVGVELFGHAGVEADVEVLALMLETLEAAGIDDVHLDLGHVGIYRALAQCAGLAPVTERTLFDILQRKARPELAAFIGAHDLPVSIGHLLTDLVELNGDETVIDDARQRLDAAGAAVVAALDELAAVAGRVRALYPSMSLHVDLAELRGYRYHTGILFAAFFPGYGHELARGGRYDGVGEVFGGARPATGFSADLHTLTDVGGPPAALASEPAVFAPPGSDSDLIEAVRRLRAAGRRVIRALPGQAGEAADMGCEQRLVRRGGDWVVEDI